MATRESMDTLIQQCEDAIRFAQDQYQEGRMQEHYNDEGYTNALQSLEGAYNDVAKMALSANSQQREQLHRMRLQLQQLQNQMIILPHN
ncbi:YtzC family protein [Cytobacillus sp. FJAT-53684]|uniref:YtzC family protein n=1 Tax=Cytobacillus mangrovibacter TaxID=3299024 RepID=A0ABW6K1Y4_9BACI